VWKKTVLWSSCSCNLDIHAINGAVNISKFDITETWTKCYSSNADNNIKIIYIYTMYFSNIQHVYIVLYTFCERFTIGIRTVWFLRWIVSRRASYMWLLTSCLRTAWFLQRLYILCAGPDNDVLGPLGQWNYGSPQMEQPCNSNTPVLNIF
jgi:hypothetical protein